MNKFDSADLRPHTYQGIWLIEKLWTDSLENDYYAAQGYEPEGYVLYEEEADALIKSAGTFTGNCWAVSETTPVRRKRKISKI